MLYPIRKLIAEGIVILQGFSLGFGVPEKKVDIQVPPGIEIKSEAPMSNTDDVIVIEGGKIITGKTYRNTGGQSQLVCLENDGKGNFNYDYSAYIQDAIGMDIVDIDNDGDKDFVINPINGNVFYFENRGEDEFERKEPLDIPNAADIEFIDIDGDYDMDAFVLENTGFVRYYKNNEGKFYPKYIIKGVKGDVIEAGHFNGDGYIDLVVVGKDTYSQHLMNKGDGDFRNVKIIHGSYTAGDIVAGDFVGEDGIDDVIVVDKNGHAQLLKNDGRGNFRYENTVSMEAKYVESGDFYGDGNEDVVVVKKDNSIYFFENVGGSFNYKSSFGNSKNVTAILADDSNDCIFYIRE